MTTQTKFTIKKGQEVEFIESEIYFKIINKSKKNKNIKMEINNEKEIEDV